MVRHCSTRRNSAGLTLLELIVAATILSILTMMALPLAKVTIKRQQEKQLRQALWEMRDAIDRYKDTADRGGFQIKADSYGYPPSVASRKAPLKRSLNGAPLRSRRVAF